jgi:hypothetical protein
MIEGRSVNDYWISHLEDSRDTIPDFHVPISRAGETFDSVLLTLFAFFPSLRTRPSIGVVPEFLPQPCHLL